MQGAAAAPCTRIWKRQERGISVKLMFASDIHGSALYAEKLLARLKDEAPQRLVLLGDILYHGPRNELPDGYAPKEVAAMLNALRPRPLCVRGNCEAEVDQMMLEFPVMAEYFPLLLDGRMAFITHGHIWNEANLPPLEAGDILIHGHPCACGAKQRGLLFPEPRQRIYSKGRRRARLYGV